MTFLLQYNQRNQRTKECMNDLVGNKIFDILSPQEFHTGHQKGDLKKTQACIYEGNASSEAMGCYCSSAAVVGCKMSLVVT